MGQSANAIKVDRLDIQRAQSAVLVEKDGVQYAIVSDDNYHFLDPYWKAMYEVPMFIQTSPYGPPTAVGGSASAKKVAVGGKLGIVKDPFGNDGAPEFMGATLPIDGYGIVNLSLSGDSKVLVGQLKGGFGTLDPFTQKPNQTHAWDVAALIKAALDQDAKDRLVKHIKLPVNAEQLLPTYPYAPAGSAFDGKSLVVKVEKAQMGDVLDLDARDRAARQLLDFSDADQQKSWSELSNTQQRQVLVKMATLSNFELQEQEKLTDPATQDQRDFTLVTNPKNGKIVSLKADGTTEADFKTDGCFFVIPNITASDLKNLRLGERVADKTGSITVRFNEVVTAANGSKSTESKTITIKLKVSDYAKANGAVFFGDRDLKNPGYTTFKLSSGVQAGVTNPTAAQLLDIYRVEQRLKYLGYAAMAANTSNTVNEFKVDGQFKAEETAALKFFEKVVRYTSATATGTGTSGAVTVEIQYRASVTATQDTPKLEEVSGSFKVTAAPANLTSAALAADITTAKTAAISKSKAAALKAANFDANEADVNGIDGKIEADANNAQRKTTLDWLNAYNAPHWMQFGDVFTQGTKLVGWVNRPSTATASTMGTSWVYDLMVASQNAAKAQNRTTPLWFAGTGGLGVQLNLGINTAYVSQQNQAGIYKDEFMLGLSDSTSVDLLNITASNAPGATPQQKLKYLLQERDRIKVAGNGTWDANSAQQLADSLQYVNRTNPAATNPNNQVDALKDFLSIYTATRNDTVVGNGSLDEQLNLIKSGAGDTTKSKQIQELLFGAGTQINGLINSNELLIGGQGSTGGGIGAQLTAQTLGAIMGRTPEAVATFVAPINEAIIKFDINTPKRLAAFLANVWGESDGLRALAENTNWNLRDPNQRFKNFKGASSAVLNQYQGQSADQKADYAFHVAALGNTAANDGHKYKGRGLMHLTWKNNYNAASTGLNNLYGANTFDLVANYLSVTDDNRVAALTGGWIWRNTNGDKNAIVDTNTYTRLLRVNGQNVLTNYPNPNFPVVTDLDAFNATTLKIRGGADIRRPPIWATTNSVVYDKNAFGNIAELLSPVGIKTENAKDHESKFGIVLNKRIAQPITNSSHQLLATDAINFENANLIPSYFQLSDQKDLVERLTNEFDVDLSEIDMLIADAPIVETPIVMQVAAAPIQGAGDVYLTMGTCELQPTAEQRTTEYYKEGYFALNPRLIADAYFFRDIARSELGLDQADVQVTQFPKHGKLSDPQTVHGVDKLFAYYPENGYVGNDRVDFLLTAKDGRKVKVVHFIKVDAKYDAFKHPKVDAYQKYCPKPSTWKISTLTPDTSADNLATWQRASDLSALIATATQSLTSFADLPGSSVGQTTGEGATAQITLDSTAAGHGWYVDPTPLDNTDDYLPTSNPNIWQAKAGSAAEGKMDMLSVLLHEYGHALGLEHSADARDFMATTLQPGERRLPSSEELALMGQLVAQRKAQSSATDASASNTPGAPASPSAPTAPLPSIPFASLGLLALGRLHSDRSGTQTLFATSAQPVGGVLVSAAPTAQYAVAANATLTNGQFNTANSWSTRGSVSVTSGAATLAESATQQTRLNQVWSGTLSKTTFQN